ncbi:MAG: S-layer homology domain-containing protein [Hydrogenibacillus schlegelii]|nr:S-layer homology domain-containing protein [Hydrogenibacillus schlegelii]
MSLLHEGRVVLVDLERGALLRTVVTGGAPARLAFLPAAGSRPETFRREAAPYSRSAFAAALLRPVKPDRPPPSGKSGTGPMADVPADHPAAPVVEAVLARGRMRGDGRGFAPDRPVTRQEAAVVLMRALALPDEGAGKGNLPVDGAAVAPRARAAVRAFVARVPALVDAT